MIATHPLRNNTRLVPAVFFMLLGIVNVFADAFFSAHSSLPTSLCFLFFFSIPLFVRKVWVYMFLGICYTLMFGIALLYGIIFLVLFLRGMYHMRDPALYFGVGFPLVIAAIVSALSLIYQCVDHSGRNLYIKTNLK